MERSDRLMGSQLLQDKVLNHPQLEVHTNMRVTEFRSEGGKLSAVVATTYSGSQRRSMPLARGSTA